MGSLRRWGLTRYEANVIEHPQVGSAMFPDTAGRFLLSLQPFKNVMFGQPAGNATELEYLQPDSSSDLSDYVSLQLRGEVLMLSDSWPTHSSRVWRATYVVSMLLVFSYILFDVLDLDASSIHRLPAPAKRTIIVAVVPSCTQINYSSDHSELRDDSALPFADRLGLNVRPPRAEVLISSVLGTARSHRYRVGLARNSLPD